MTATARFCLDLPRVPFEGARSDTKDILLALVSVTLIPQVGYCVAESPRHFPLEPVALAQQLILGLPNDFPNSI